MKKIIMVDMDDTIADFGGAFLGMRVDDSKMYEPGFFLNLKPVPGALSAVRKLIKLGYDVQILTQPVAESAHCYREKVQWVGKWFPELYSKINMVQDKGLIRGDYLIDDNEPKWRERFESGGGKFVHFRYMKDNERRNRLCWEMIVEQFESYE